MTLVLGLAGILALVGGIVLLRRTGNAWRVGRLLAAAPQVGLGEVEALVRGDRRAYVRTRARISSDEEFPDENQRPLVYRRRRLELREPGGRWRAVEDDRVAVPFGLEDRQVFVAVDVDALGDGLVAIPREAAGTLEEVPEGMRGAIPADLSGSTPVRLVIEQVSAVEHATVAGVPTTGPDGRVMLTAGMGRPLIVTTLELDAAMRILASGHRGTVRMAAVLLAVGPVLLAGALVAALLGA